MSLRGLKLPLNTINDNNSSGTGNGNGKDHPPNISSYFSESNIHQDIKITFSLPSGELFEETVKNGETVQEIKRRLCSASKIPSNSEFFFNGNPMLDPLSLNDIPGVVGNSSLQIEVKVKGQTTSNDVINKGKTTNETDQHDTITSKQLISSTPPTAEKHQENIPPEDTKQTENVQTQEQIYDTGNGKDEKSTSSSSSRGMDTYNDTPTEKDKDASSSTQILNFVEPAPSSSHPPDLSTIPSHPHAAFDDETTIPKSAPDRPKTGTESETTIDVKDDGTNQKQIQSLGGGKRWFCSVV